MDTTGLPIDFEAKRGCGRLTLDPEVNNSAWDVVERSGTQVISQLEKEKVTSLIVDLSPLNYLGSAQVALLVRVWKALSARNGKMVVQVNSPVVRDVLKTAGLNRLWEFVDSQAKAYEFLGVNPDGVHTVNPVWTFVGGVTAVAALVATALELFQPELLGATADWIAIGNASIAIFAGLFVALRAGGIPRLMGIIILLAGLGVCGVQLYPPFNPSSSTEIESRPESDSDKEQISADAKATGESASPAEPAKKPTGAPPDGGTANTTPPTENKPPETPATQPPVENKPVHNKPVEEKPAGDKPVEEKPPEEQPAADKPAAAPPAGVEAPAIQP
ncbi:MAG: STAS domain-containing protein [Planctomycetota bacterium]|nr:STAS domain-containing protein [Planctomycetota bacterium]